MDKTTKAFMAHLPHNQVDIVLEMLKPLCINYLIGLETKDYEHMHFFVEGMSDKNYEKFKRSCFITKYKLKGKAMHGNPRQYGKLTEINDLERMKGYTLKDGNIKTNFDNKSLKLARALAFQKKDAGIQFVADCVLDIQKNFIYKNNPEDGYDKKKFNGESHFPPGIWTQYDVLDEQSQLRLYIIGLFQRKNLKTISKTRIENVLLAYYMTQKEEGCHAIFKNLYYKGQSVTLEAPGPDPISIIKLNT